MKKTFIRFFLLILALVVVSCSKDDSINYHTELSLEEPHYILGNVCLLYTSPSPRDS